MITIRIIAELLVIGLGMVIFTAAFVLLVAVNMATRALTKRRGKQNQWPQWNQDDPIEFDRNNRSNRNR